MSIAHYRGKGSNPNSHRNLEGNRRVPLPRWGSVKKEHVFGLTDEAWEVLRQLSDQHDVSVSDWVEATARLLEQDKQLGEQVLDLLRGRLEKSGHPKS
ncbi:hypothetical protein AB3R30_23340 [Leptolyngbyaceae cyanobacterium UHCC 1019]